MCGIAGWIGASAPMGRLDRYLQAACTAMLHRGPDSEGRHVEGCAALGARRLAIIDLDTGDQPVYSEDGSVVAVLNGEIYNYTGLRSELESAGHRFKSLGDTEVLAHAYEEWGDGMLARLHGMFALAVWDSGQQQLLVAVDRIGKKPLFYTESAGGLRFASELKAMLADGAVRARPDLKSLWALFALQYIPPSRSPLAGIGRLGPGQKLTYTPGDTPRISAYWSLADEAAGRLRPPEQDDLRTRIDEAVACRLRADVPLGVFLSGGLDSSLVAASAAAQGGRLKTLSVGFEGAGFSELPLARQVAAAFDTDHTEVEVGWRDAALLAKLAWHLDEPLADSSALPTYKISQAASAQGLKVVLSGDGGDELFGGYDRYPLFLKWDEQFERVHAFRLAGGAARAGRALLAVGPGERRTTRRARDLARKAGVFFRLAAEPMPDRYLHFLGAFPPGERARLAGPAFMDAGLTGGPAGLRSPGPPTDAELLGAVWPLRSEDPLASLGALDATGELPGDILVKVDRMSMACSLEVRSPLLDHGLVSWALRLPDSVRLRDGKTKPLMRDLAAELLPAPIASAPKRGFGIPLSRWMRRELRPTVEGVLRDPLTRGRGLTSPAAVDRLLEEHAAGREHGARLWMLMMLELWCRSYLDPVIPREITL